MIRNTAQEDSRRYYLAITNPIDEIIKNLTNYFNTSPVILVLAKLPETVCLKYLAYYLALSSKEFSNYGEIRWKDSGWLNHATVIHIVLRKKLEEKLNIILRYPGEMSSLQRKVAENAGVVFIAPVASNLERDRSNILSCDVTKELALDLLKLLSEFNYLFDDTGDTKEGQKQSHSSDIDKEKIASTSHNQPSLKPSDIGHDSTHNLKLAIERLFKENPKHEPMPTALWNTLGTKGNDQGYKIKSIQGHGNKVTITFNCGHSHNYHSAQVHIKKVIKWHNETKK